MSVTAGRLTVLVVGGLLLSSTAGSQENGRSFSDAECAVLAAYDSATAKAEVRSASRWELRRQLHVNPPLARLDGYWVSPIDLRRLLAVAAGHDRRLFAAWTPVEETRSFAFIALAFTPDQLRTDVPLPDVGPIRGHRGAPTPGSEIVLVPIKDTAQVVVEYLPPPTPEVPETPECYYFCGDPAQWDFDGDGTPNPADPDDDGDGTPDERDAYPFHAGLSGCDCDERDFVGLTGKFSAQITRLLLAAHDRVTGADTADLGGVLLETPDDAVGIRVLPVERCGTAPSGCPNAGRPGVSYVSRDPAVCAVIRFRCEEGKVPFSSRCGCGCVPDGD